MFMFAGTNVSGSLALIVTAGTVELPQSNVTVSVSVNVSVTQWHTLPWVIGDGTADR